MDAIEERKALVKGRKIPIPEGVDVGEWFYTDGQAGFPEKPQEDSQVDTTGDITGLIEEYLAGRRLDVEAGQLGHASYASDQYHLSGFRRFCETKGATDLAVAVGTGNLNAYRTQEMGRLARGEISAVTVRHVLRTVKALMRWAFDQEILDSLPRILNKYRIAVPAPTPQFFEVDEVKGLYDAATDPVKLYILLGLNCGYTQSDIATLEHSHVDWGQAMIVRDRNKTGQAQEHKLWQRTLTLLKRQATPPRDSSLVLLSQSGKSLLQQTINADGKPSRMDAIGIGFRQIRGHVNWARKESQREIKLTFKYFRKTGANMIAKEYQANPFLVDLYQAHAHGGMRRHYAQQHYGELHKATDWLASIYGFDKEESSSSGGNP